MKNTIKNLAFLGALALAAALLFPTAQAQQNTGNLNCTLLGSAIRTTSVAVSSGDRDNSVWRGVVVMVNISTYTTGTFTPVIQGKDPVSGNYYTILTGTARSTSTGSPFIMRVFPGLTAGSDIANDVLPKTWRLTVTGSSTPVAAYSVGCSLID